MFILILSSVVVACLAIAIILIDNQNKIRWQVVSAIVGLVLIMTVCWLAGNWWLMLLAAGVGGLTQLAILASQNWLKVSLAVGIALFTAAFIVGFIWLSQPSETEACPTCPTPEVVVITTPEPVVVTTPEPIITEVPVVEVCHPAELYDLRTGGEVMYNLDDGDAVMGTIVIVTRDDPSTSPVLFIIMPGSSFDIEYAGKMYFTSDRFAGSPDEAICLAEQLHPDVIDKIIIGVDEAPEGWHQIGDLDGWWTLSTWLYQEEPIVPEGLTASNDVFISTTQTARTLETFEGQVIYGQFWNPDNPGHVVHIQIRPNEKLTIPLGWEGVYWVWTGDFSLGEADLQKRMLQATFVEVADRDDILGVTLLACGNLPVDLDESLLFFPFRGHDITWNSGLTGWDCQPVP